MVGGPRARPCRAQHSGFSIREATQKGWVLGRERFAPEVEAMLNRRAQPLRRGGDRRSVAYRTARTRPEPKEADPEGLRSAGQRAGESDHGCADASGGGTPRGRSCPGRRRAMPGQTGGRVPIRGGTRASAPWCGTGSVRSPLASPSQVGREGNALPGIAQGQRPLVRVLATLFLRLAHPGRDVDLAMKHA
jgi:hypothetical protein